MNDLNGSELPSEIDSLLAAGAWAEAQRIALDDPVLVLVRLRRLLQYGAAAPAELDLIDLETRKSLPAAVTIERLALQLHNYGCAEDCFETAKALLLEGGLDEVTHVRALMVRAIAQHRLSAWQAALRDVTEGLALVETLGGDPRLRMELLQVAATIDSWRGYHSQALLRLTLALADCALIGDRVIMGRLLGECGRVNLEIRRYAHAFELLKRQGEISNVWLDVQARVRHALATARALIGLARYEEALTLARKAQISARELGSAYLASMAKRDEALALVRTGQFDDARLSLETALADVADRKSSYEYLALEAVEAELLAAIDAEDAVKRLLGVVERFADANLVAHEIDARLLLGEVLTRRGQNGPAYQAVSEAVRRAKRANLTILEAKARETLARLDLTDELVFEEARQISQKNAAALDGYILVKKLGGGASGTVYQAFDVEEAREVALKLLSAERSQSFLTDRLQFDSALREYQAAARIRHRGFARVLGFGRSAEGKIYSVQEYISGPTLREAMDRSRCDARALVRLLLLLCEPLSVLHDTGVVHCDLTPSNIICRTSDEPVIIDLGISSASDRESTGGGTAGYAAPELREGGKVDGRSDIFSLGAIAFEWLANRPPERPAQYDIVRGCRLTKEDRELLNSRAVPRDFIRLVSEMLSAKMRHRPRDVVTLSNNLKKLSLHNEG